MCLINVFQNSPFHITQKVAWRKNAVANANFCVPSMRSGLKTRNKRNGTEGTSVKKGSGKCVTQCVTRYKIKIQNVTIIKKRS